MENCKWTYKMCYDEAKKYLTRNEFRNNCRSAYRMSKTMGWIDDYTWFISGHLIESNKRRKWTYEKCYQEAKKYKSRTEFQRAKGASCAYKTARKHGWLDDYTWFTQYAKPAGYWNYETCYKEAKKYRFLVDFRKRNASVYVIARKNGWLKDFNWLIKKEKHWTYKECFDFAKRHTTLIEFKSACPSAYKASVEYGWINDYTWFTIKPRCRYWTQEKCYEEAKKYSSKKEFALNSSAYSIACKNGWIIDYVWLIDKRLEIFKDRIDCVYSYYFKETNTIYIGRTINKKNRDYQHIFMTDRDSVAKYAKELGCAVPPMIIIEDYLTLKEGLEKEDFWKNYYEEMGFNILNKAPTGVGRGSIGSIGCGKWTKKACFEEAKKYSTRNAFKRNNGSAYSAALKRGWLKDYVWFEELKTPETYWTYERCYEIAKQCKTKKEFYSEHERAYRVAYKNGWGKDYTWFITPIHKVKWTYEKCMEKAKTCKSKVEFEKKFPSAMNVARKNGWLKNYIWFERPIAYNLKWTYESCKIEASKYTSRGEFSKVSKGAYLKAYRNGWLDDFFPKS